MAEKIYVRVNAKKREVFFRAGMQFTKEWQEIEVDEATAGALQAEQMLEVSEALPPELVVVEPAQAVSPEPAQTFRPEPVEGQSGSTSSPQADELVAVEPVVEPVAVDTAKKSKK